MIRSAKALFLMASLGCVLRRLRADAAENLGAKLRARPPTPRPTPITTSRMGRLYAEMGQADDSRTEINKAIPNYEEALKLDSQREHDLRRVERSLYRHQPAAGRHQ